MRPVSVQFIGNAAEEFEKLNKKQKIELIKANPQYGDSRMLYTLKGSQVEILCFILEVIDHRRYDKIFGYRKK